MSRINQLIVFFALLGGLLQPMTVSGQCSAIVDLNTWTQEGPASSGVWTVNGAGTSVVQSINGSPTFFVSPQSFINVRMTGTLATQGPDDDFMGFVFGYNGPFGGAGPNYDFDCYLFDWNRNPHGCANPGRALSRLDGNFNPAANAAFLCQRTNFPGYTVIANNSNPGTGWLPGVTYNFELTYLTDRIVIVVNNDTFFDVAGCYEPGRFGFYNYSQSPVTYSNFSYQLLPEFSIAASNVCLNDSAEFFYIVDTCTSVSAAQTVVAAWDWDFGDGNSSTAINPKHLYAAPGTYTVQLVVTDFLGCQDSASQVITVAPLPATPTAANNGPLCEGDQLNLTGAGGGGVTYSWTGPNSYAASAQNPTINSVSPANSGVYTLVTNNGNCNSPPATTNVTVNPTPLTPNVSSNSPVCEDSAIFLVASNVGAGSSYLWTGPNGFNAPQRTPTINNPTTAATGAYTVTATINGCPSATASIPVTVNPTPVVSIAGDTAICIGDPATLTASGAASYAWNTGPTTPSITVSPNTTTTYSVVGTSAAGCPAPPEPFTVQALALPTVNLGPDVTVCDQVILDAGPAPQSYLWSTGATTQTIAVTTSGTYAVTVTNGDSCTASDTINVIVNNTVLADLGPDQDICPGTSTTLTPAPGGFASYLWSNGSTAPSIVVSTSGTYYVDVVDANGCPSSDTILVNVWPLLSGSIGVDTLICSGDSLVLDASVWGGAIYAWSTGAVTPSITVGSPGTYSVTIDDGNGCTYEDSLALQVDVPPTLSVTVSASSSCSGDPVLFTASPQGLVNYEFLLGNASQQSTPINTWTTTALQMGDSVFVVGTTSDGCPTNVVVAAPVTILPRPFGSAAVDTVCAGSPTTFSATSSGATSITWIGTGGLTGSGSSVSYTYAGPGTYTYALTLGNGSCDTIINGNVLVLPVPPAPAAPSDSACIGQDALLSATGTGTVEWFDAPSGGALVTTGNTLLLPNVALSDTFWVRETQQGCIGPFRQVILSVYPNPIAEFISSPDTTVRLDIPRADLQFVNLSSGATSYFWDFGDGTTSTNPGPMHSYFEIGDYTVTLIASTRENCADTFSIGIYEVVDNEEEFYVPSAFTPNGDGDNDVWIIDELFYFPDHTLQVFNRWGTVILDTRNYQNDWDGTWKGEPLPEGTYYYFIDLGDDSEPLKGFVMLYR